LDGEARDPVDRVEHGQEERVKGFPQRLDDAPKYIIQIAKDFDGMGQQITGLVEARDDRALRIGKVLLWVKEKLQSMPKPRPSLEDWFNKAVGTKFSFGTAHRMMAYASRPTDTRGHYSPSRVSRMTPDLTPLEKLQKVASGAKSLSTHISRVLHDETVVQALQEEFKANSGTTSPAVRPFYDLYDQINDLFRVGKTTNLRRVS
jgi:hypothetical protein